MTRARRAIRFAAFALCAGAGGACTLLVDTSGFLTVVDGAGADAAPDAAVLGGDASDATASRDGAPSVDGLPSVDGAASGGGGSYRQAVLDDKPTSYWRFEETSGTIAKDEMGRHDGTYVGKVAFGLAGATPTSRAVGVGTAGAVEIGDLFDLSGDAPYTLEGWMRTDGGSGDLMNKMFYVADQPATGWLLTLDMPQGRYAFECWWSGAARRGATTIVPPTHDRFAYVVVTFDGTTAPKISIDGVTETDPTLSFQNPGAPIDNGVKLMFGDGFGGAIDEIAIYDHVLTPVRIAAHLAAAR